MSRCRCSDITDTENKIRKLEGAQGSMSGYYGCKERLDNELKSCAMNASHATASENVVFYQATMTTLGNGMNETAGKIIGKINARLSELRSSLSSMRQEDHDYHEEQRRRAEEEAAARAAAAAAVLIAKQRKTI